MAKEASSPQGRQTAAEDRSGGGIRYDVKGFGVVPALEDLLQKRLPGWREPDLGDCVSAAGTTAPRAMPLPAPPMRAVGVSGSIGGDGDGTRSTSASGFVQTHASSYGSGGSVRELRSVFKKGGSSRDGVAGGTGSSPAVLTHTPQPATDPRSAPTGEDAALTVPRHGPPLRLPSATGLLLTPRSHPATAASPASPLEVRLPL